MDLKEKSIGQMTMTELNELTNRLRSEREAERLILDYLRRSDEQYNYDNPPRIDTKTPIGKFIPIHSDFFDKTISELTSVELSKLLSRLRAEEEIAYLILDLKRNNGEKLDYDNSPKINNSTPINQMYHAGIKGMQWGVRRYQNEDGTLTSEGKKRYGSLEKDLQKGSKILSDLGKIQSTSKSKKIKKDYSQLTDSELQKRVNRLNLEENYGRLTGETKFVRSGSEWAKEILQTSGAIVGIAGGAVGLYLSLKK